MKKYALIRDTVEGCMPTDGTLTAAQIDKDYWRQPDLNMITEDEYDTEDAALMALDKYPVGTATFVSWSGKKMYNAEIAFVEYRDYPDEDDDEYYETDGYSNIKCEEILR